MTFKSTAFSGLVLHMLVFVLGSSRVQSMDETTASHATTSISISSTTSTVGKASPAAKPTTISTGMTASAVSSTKRSTDGDTHLRTAPTSKPSSASSNTAVSQKISTASYTEKINSSPSLKLPCSVSSVVMFLAMILFVTCIFI